MKYNILFLVIYLLLFSCKSKQEKTKPILESITESVYASGIVKSKNQYKVFSLVNGQIDTILVTEGDIIKKGDVILRLTNTTSLLNAENARLSADFASVKDNAEKLDELKISIDLAKIKMQNDALLLQKQEILWSKNIGTENELIQKQLSYKNSLNAYQSAKLRLTELQKQIIFQEKQAKNNLEISKKTNSDFTIKSEVNGRVYDILVEKGEMVNTSNPVAVIGDNLVFLLELYVDEYDIQKIKSGQRIFLSMDSYKGEIFEAFVSKINPIMNEKTKSFTIEANFVSAPKILYPNLTCEANIVIHQKPKALTIPRSYLLEGDFILLEKNKKVKVITGLKDYQKVEIISGITTSDFIYKQIE